MEGEGQNSACDCWRVDLSKTLKLSIISRDIQFFKKGGITDFHN